MPSDLVGALGEDFRRACNLPSEVAWLNVVGSPEGETTTFLAVDVRRRAPALALKVARRPGTSFLGNEAKVTARLRGVSSVLCALIPPVMFHGRAHGHEVLATSFADGTPIAAARFDDAPTAREHFAFAAATCQLMATRTVTLAEADSLASNIRSDVARFDEIARPSAPARRRIDDACRAIQPIVNRGPVVEHGDFCRHNVLALHGSPTAVIDWTTVREDGLPLHDLLFFLAAYRRDVPADATPFDYAVAFRAALHPSAGASSLERQALTRAATAMEIDSALEADLTILFLVRQSVREAQRLERRFARGFVPRQASMFLSQSSGRRSALGSAQFWPTVLFDFIDSREDLAA